MFIAFHGTNEAEALSILKSGFNSGTYFAQHLEDAIIFGGPFVFEVAFDGPQQKDWQFCEFVSIPPDRIVSLERYEITKMLENKELRARVFKWNMENNK